MKIFSHSINKLLFFCAISVLISCSVKNHSLINKEYYFIHTDCEISKISFYKDSILENKCYCMKPCASSFVKINNIISVTEDTNRIIFKLEDRKKNNSNPLKQYYSILVFSKKGEDSILLHYKIVGLSKNDIYENFKDSFNVQKQYGFTFFSKAKYEQFSSLRTINNYEEYKTLSKNLDSTKYKNRINKYISSYHFDMYNSMIIADINVSMLLENKINPITSITKIYAMIEAQKIK
jgi:phosphotransferase system IIB component